MGPSVSSCPSQSSSSEVSGASMVAAIVQCVCRSPRRVELARFRALIRLIAGRRRQLTLLSRLPALSTMNLVLASGLACALIGGLVMCGSYRALYLAATRIVAGYPGVLAGLHAKRQDARFGLGMLVCGIVLQTVAAGGYVAPLSLWIYPACAIGAV